MQIYEKNQSLQTLLITGITKPPLQNFRVYPEVLPNSEPTFCRRNGNSSRRLV